MFELLNIGILSIAVIFLWVFIVGFYQRKKIQQESLALNTATQQLRTQVAVLEAQQQGAKKQLKDATEEIAALKKEDKSKQARLDCLLAENAQLNASQKEKTEQFARQLKQLDEQKKVLKNEFENLAHKIFEDKGKAFTEHNKQSLDGLLNPFKEQIAAFRHKVEDIHHKDVQQQAQLQAELKHLQTLNKQITEEAHQLATALKGQKKMQGNWGELMLENVLDRSGLQQGKDYEREVSINTDDGRSRPDVIVHLPDQKHLVIDAKVSLNAYVRYVNANNEAERQQALKEHVAAIAGRIKELADKRYFDLPGLNSPEVVFMFIPIESAFVEALKAEEGLFQKALAQNVLVATPTTLLTSLNIVRQLWRFEDQNKHTAELADKAAKVYDKLNSFLASMDGVGKALDRAKENYDKAYSQLYAGRGNLIKQANEFKKLGVSVKADLPAHVLDKAELELSHEEEEPKNKKK